MTESGEKPGLFDNIPDADLWELFESIRNGAQNAAESFGFPPEAMNTVEQMALAFYRNKNYSHAAQLYSFLLRMDPRRSSAWRGLGAVCQAQKFFVLALRAYDQAVTHDPSDVISRVLCGECLCLNNDRENGVRLLEDTLKAGSTDPRHQPYLTRARAIVNAKGGIPARIVLMQNGKQLAADAAAMQAQGVTFDPDRPLTVADIENSPQLSQPFNELKDMLNAGTLTFGELGGFTEIELDGAYACAAEYTAMGRVAEALQISGLLQFVDPYRGRYYQLTGICLQRMKQYELADQYYGTAMIFDPDDARNNIYRGECLILMGQIDAGAALVKRGVELAQSDDDLAKRGQALLQQFKK